LGKISVGPPYFNMVFMVPMLPLAILLGVGMHGAWRRANGPKLWQRLRWPAVLAIVLGVMTSLFLYSGSNAISTIGVVTAMWVMISSLIIPITHKRRTGHFSSLSRGLTGMFIAHFGVGLFILGVTVTSTFGTEEDLGMSPGETVTVEGYEFTFRGLRDVKGANYEAVEAEIEVRRNARQVTILTPQKRVYRVQKSSMTEAGIDAGWTRDLFVALGEPLGNNRWSLRIQYKPLIRFIWLGALFMAFGGLIAATDKRYRSRARAKIPAAAAGEAAR
jgi:cytochrome c-type biogenesis protein CcmF